MAHLQTYYGYRSLAVGETAIVTARFAPGDAAHPVPVLAGDGGVAVGTPMLWIPTLGEARWRIAATAPGAHQVRLILGGEVLTKTVLVSGGVGRHSARRPSTGWLGQILYPAEPPLAGGGAVTAIEMGYPQATVGLLGWDAHWVVGFLILTLLAALALRGTLRVTF
jgi:hypothetical protein